MVTQLYGDKINTPPRPAHEREAPPPQLLPTVEMRAAEPIKAPESLPPPRPAYPTPAPTPWLGRKPNALQAMVLGMLAAGAVFGGLALCGVALVWSHALSAVACVGLLLLGGYLLSAGIAYVVGASPQTA